MRYWTGILLFAGAAFLMRNALARRARVLADRARGRSAPAPGASLAALGDVLPPMVILTLAFVGVKTTLAYFAFGGARVLSLFDLLGLHALLAAYGTSLLLATRYREATVVPADAPLAHEAGDEARPAPPARAA